MRYENHAIDPALQGAGTLGEVRQAADGSLYEWVETVDGLGNPIGGFWNKIKSALKVVKEVAPLVAPMVPGGSLVQTGLKLARRARPLRRLVRRALPLAQRYSRYVPPGYRRRVSRGLRRARPYLRRAGFAGHGPLGDAAAMRYEQLPGEVDDMSYAQDVGSLGEIRQDEAGNAYEWIEGVDGLGNAVGLWQPVGDCERCAPLGDSAADVWEEEDSGALHRIEGYESDPDWSVGDDPDADDEVFLEEPVEPVEGYVEGYVEDTSTDALGAYVKAEPEEMPAFVSGKTPEIWRPLW